MPNAQFLPANLHSRCTKAAEVLPRAEYNMSENENQAIILPMEKLSAVTSGMMNKKNIKRFKIK